MKKMRAARKRLGITQAELAAKAGLKRSWVAAVETRKIRSPNPEKLEKIAQALELQLEDLIADVPVEETKTSELRSFPVVIIVGGLRIEITPAVSSE